MISNTKELKRWLQDRGVRVVGTRTLRTGELMATSCSFYGKGRSHCFRIYPHEDTVRGTHVDASGHEEVVECWPVTRTHALEESE